jgi:hypothetical protein
MLVLFRMLTSDGWNLLMQDCMLLNDCTYIKWV